MTFGIPVVSSVHIGCGRTTLYVLVEFGDSASSAEDLRVEIRVQTAAHSTRRSPGRTTARHPPGQSQKPASLGDFGIPFRLDCRLTQWELNPANRSSLPFSYWAAAGCWQPYPARERSRFSCQDRITIFDTGRYEMKRLCLCIHNHQPVEASTTSSSKRSIGPTCRSSRPCWTIHASECRFTPQDLCWSSSNSITSTRTSIPCEHWSTAGKSSWSAAASTSRSAVAPRARPRGADPTHER